MQRLNFLERMIITHHANLVCLLAVANREGRTNGWDTVDGVMRFDNQAEVINGLAGVNRDMVKVLSNDGVLPA